MRLFPASARYSSLEEAGFRCADGMAAGLLLRVDREAVLRFHAASEASGTPARTSQENLPIRELP